ncbi:MULTISPECIES: hypothetical protein [unclassified Pseudomonas]|uniref:hypothetical protein n=1 Tax=unclassified Pseudomonas TaxID=196821 RepID=UPI002114DAE1|nr:MULTISPECIES: hypothetical protein [unclassified Pseudomonas]
MINDNQRLGALNLSLDSAVADGVEMYTLISSGPTTWAPSIILSPHALSAFTPIRNVTVPAPVQQLSALLSIQPIIAPTDTLLLTKEAPIDGSVTLTVKYL